MLSYQYIPFSFSAKFFRLIFLFMCTGPKGMRDIITQRVNISIVKFS